MNKFKEFLMSVLNKFKTPAVGVVDTTSPAETSVSESTPAKKVRKPRASKKPTTK